jgi:hypothetical protein
MLAETVVEFILCSRMKSSVAAPPQGIVVYPLPPTLIVMLDSADIQVISLSRLLKPAVKAAPTTSTAKVTIFPYLHLLKLLSILFSFRWRKSLLMQLFDVNYSEHILSRN